MSKFNTLMMTGLLAVSSAVGAGEQKPRVLLDTSHGEIVVELAADKATATVDNFLGYVESGFYDGTIFHRVIQDFMIQGGGFTTDYEQKPTGPAIENEGQNCIANRRGTIAMARTGDPHSATTQFFINTTDNPNLNFRKASGGGWGYCAFGRVVEGLDTVDKIAAVPTSAVNRRFRNAPEGLVVIEKASRLDSKASKDAKPEDSESAPKNESES